MAQARSRDWCRTFLDSRHQAILHASTSYLHINCAMYQQRTARRKMHRRADFDEECEARDVCWTSALVERKLNKPSASFPRLLHIAAHFHRHLVITLFRTYHWAPAWSRCITVLSTVRYGKHICSFQRVCIRSSSLYLLEQLTISLYHHDELTQQKKQPTVNIHPAVNVFMRNAIYF